MTDFETLPLAIPSRSPFTLIDMKAQDRDAPPDFKLDAKLYMPRDRDGPVPAVVISHGLGGAKPAREHRYGRFLAEHGYATLVFDSFVSRNMDRFGDPVKALRVTETMLLADAFAALEHLSVRPEIRSDAIAVAGFSYGGMIAMLTAYEQMASLFLPNGPRFSAHVSYYGCTVPRLDDPRTTGAPVALMDGELDANTSMDRLAEIAADLTAGGSNVRKEIFEGIYHQWDGDDRSPRKVRFHLANCRFRIGRDNRVRDEGSSLVMKGPWSRALMIARSVVPRGYVILADQDATARSDRILLETLAEGITHAACQDGRHEKV
ncbi:dienelactone hydrolase family protein [Jiella marina]|uniref:dienelactone hydrolase family protein n=1 Tax=Jiella sp. LLJ827 TaxID=2917712 RepID=UPI0021013771|nr:dienelactone hydrolase family protein [Jiella sp. LLJ827]MCQ0986505.1 dienelactone hydrolase family protein [Jiella sp. LLJ827]